MSINTRMRVAVMMASGAFGAYTAVASAGAPVTSLLEARQHRVVVQQWDLSCGAAALATLLRHQFGEPVTEREVALELIKRREYLADPTLVMRRQGFSLLDLQRVAERYNYRGLGLGRLAFDDLLARAPMIVPVRLNGYNHFVVFRGVYRGQVVLADPSWGNRTLSVHDFEQAWMDDPRVGRIGFAVLQADGRPAPNRLAPSAADLLIGPGDVPRREPLRASQTDRRGPIVLTGAFGEFTLGQSIAGRESARDGVEPVALTRAVSSPARNAPPVDVPHAPTAVPLEPAMSFSPTIGGDVSVVDGAPTNTAVAGRVVDSIGTVANAVTDTVSVALPDVHVASEDVIAAVADPATLSHEPVAVATAVATGLTAGATYAIDGAVSSVLPVVERASADTLTATALPDTSIVVDGAVSSVRVTEQTSVAVLTTATSLPDATIAALPLGGSTETLDPIVAASGAAAVAHVAVGAVDAADVLSMPITANAVETALGALTESATALTSLGVATEADMAASMEATASVGALMTTTMTTMMTTTATVTDTARVSLDTATQTTGSADALDVLTTATQPTRAAGDVAVGAVLPVSDAVTDPSTARAAVVGQQEPISVDDALAGISPSEPLAPASPMPGARLAADAETPVTGDAVGAEVSAPFLTPSPVHPPTQPLLASPDPETAVHPETVTARAVPASGPIQFTSQARSSVPETVPPTAATRAAVPMPGSASLPVAVGGVLSPAGSAVLR